MNRLFIVLSFLMTSSAFAQEGAKATAEGSGMAAIAAGLCMGLAVFGGALGQSKAAAAALEGIGRNPAAGKQLFTPMIIALALIESLVLLAFVVAFIKIQL